jgi:hypothetical protein
VREKKMKVSLTCSTTSRIRVSRRAHVGSGDLRCMVTGCSVVCARCVDRREPFKRLLWLTSGPRLHFVFSKIFNHPNFEI